MEYEAGEIRTIEPHGPYIGRSSLYGDIALYNETGASMYIGADDFREARRAARAVRRYLGRPTRIRVTITEGPSYSQREDTCDVYGWRAALVAARAMRAECDERSGPWIHVTARDARLTDLVESL